MPAAQGKRRCRHQYLASAARACEAVAEYETARGEPRMPSRALLEAAELRRRIAAAHARGERLSPIISAQLVCSASSSECESCD